MIRDSKISMLIDEYKDGNLPNNEMLAFENTLMNDASLQEELKLMQEIETALTETDVHQLRNILQENSQAFLNSPHTTPQFTLAENTDPDKIFDQAVLHDEIMGHFEALPRIHINNHHRNGQEKIHQLYKETLSDDTRDVSEDEFTADDLWPDLENALSEKDIMNLRDSLGQIRKATLTHDISMEEIEDYIHGNMTFEDAESFEQEMSVNPEIAREVGLAADLEAAVSENDIMELRESLRLVMEKQTSTPFSFQELDEFISGEASSGNTEFIAGELDENDDVRAELSLLREVNMAIGEHDVHELRNMLQVMRNELPVRKEKSLLASNTSQPGTRRFGIVAAIMVIMLGISVLIKYSVDTPAVLESYLGETPMAITSFRTAAPEMNSFLIKGFQLYNQGDFKGALTSFREVLEVESLNPAAWFYTGAALQGQKDYGNAITAYEKVISHQDNIFTEQAEWYLGLCYLNTEQPDKARMIFEAIVNKEGFYDEKAAFVLKKLRKKG
jgi:hypothetical protein